MPGFDGINTISTDERGFRTTGFVRCNPKNPYRIFAIEGSTTEEIFVDNHETWTARLENILKIGVEETIEVINTGVSGLRAKHHLSTLLNTEQLNPDLYIFLLGVNDWNHHIKNEYSADQADIKLTVMYSGLIKIKNIITQNIIHQNKSPNYNAIYGATVKEFGEYYSSQNNSLTNADVRTLRFSEVSENYVSAMQKISQRCSGKYYQCLFVSQPSAFSTEITDELRTRLWMTPRNEEYTLDLESLIQIADLYNSWLRDFTQRNDFPFCDLAAQIEPSTKYLYDDVHFNEHGSLEVSELIANSINKQIGKI
jgi:lysophospholipase L1-like esterase